MRNELLVSINQIAAERVLPTLVVVSAIERALKVAYERDPQYSGQNVDVSIDTTNGKVSVNTYREVVSNEDYNVANEKNEVSLDDARKKDPELNVGDKLFVQELGYNQGRITAHATKQMIIQNLGEAEHSLVFEQFKEYEHKLVTGKIYRFERRDVLVEILDVGRAIGIMPLSEQSPAETYRVGQQMKFYVARVIESSRSSEVILSRSHPEMIRRLFEREIPEIEKNTVEIKAIAREVGARTKVAVTSSLPGTDPVGTCVGLRGIRIQNIVNELMGEKVDVVSWSEDDSIFIMNSLNPANVEKAILDYETRSAQAVVPERNLSLAIGKDGQNARLSAKLTNWSIEIVSSTDHSLETEPEEEVKAEKQVEAEAVVEEESADAEAPTQSDTGTDIKSLEEELARLKSEESKQQATEEPVEPAPKEDTIDLEEAGVISQPANPKAEGNELTFAEDIREIQQTWNKPKTSTGGRKKKRAPKKN